MLRHVTEITVAEPCRVIHLSGSKMQDIAIKYSENFVEHFPSSNNGKTESLSTQKLFHTVAVHSKSSIEKLNICCQESRLLK